MLRRERGFLCRFPLKPIEQLGGFFFGEGFYVFQESLFCGHANILRHRATGIGASERYVACFDCSPPVW